MGEDTPITQARRIVVTGAPGTGKTAILSALSGIHLVPEPARVVLAEERSSGGRGTPESDPSLFVELLLRRSIENHRAARGAHVSLFDRGIPDCVAYAVLLGADPEPSRRAAAVHRYVGTVLVARPWRDIYTTDDERKMTFEATLPFHSLIERAYEEAGYELVEIPFGALAERVGFVTRFVAAIDLRP